MTYLDDALSDVPGSIALLGVAGSRAFGLATSESDTDYRGCYVVPTKDLFRLVTPAESYAHNKPDVAMHEVGKLLRHAVAANPTALETLHYSDYVICDRVGAALLEHRGLFITEKIRATHLGFAKSQFEKMKKRYDPMKPHDQRDVKHARHTLRVIRLTEKALTTGVYDLTVDDPDEIFAFGELDPSERIYRAQKEVARIAELPSVLPPGPDMDAVNNMLIRFRQMNLFTAGDER
jgi:hypothetical protein